MKKTLGLALASAVLSVALFAGTPAFSNEEAAPAAQEITLKDGTKVEVLDGAVSVVGADGTKTPAPDGTHEAADGSKITTKDGKIVQ